MSNQANITTTAAADAATAVEETTPVVVAETPVTETPEGASETAEAVTETPEGASEAETVAETSETGDAEPAATSGEITTGQIIDGTVKAVLDYGVLVRLGANGPTGLLHHTQMTGGTHGNRKSRRDELASQFEEGRKDRQDVVVAVEVLRIREGKDGGARRYDLSERSLQEAAVRETLKPGNDSEAGTQLNCVVTQHREYGVICAVTEGPAKGYNVLLHASQVPGSRREERDRYCADLADGSPITVEVLKVEEADKEGQDLRIGVTIVAESRRELAEQLGDSDRVYKGTAIKGGRGGQLVEFGSMDTPMRGILPAGEVPSALKVGGSVRVKIKSVQGDEIILTRKGIK